MLSLKSLKLYFLIKDLHLLDHAGTGLTGKSLI